MGLSQAPARSEYHGFNVDIQYEEGNHIKDKAWVVGNGYMQQLWVDYKETWVAVTQLESVRMTAAVIARYNIKFGESTSLVPT